MYDQLQGHPNCMHKIYNLTWSHTVAFPLGHFGAHIMLKWYLHYWHTFLLINLCYLINACTCLMHGKWSMFLHPYWCIYGILHMHMHIWCMIDRQMNNLLRLDVRSPCNRALHDRSFRPIMQRVAPAGSNPLYHPPNMICCLVIEDLIEWADGTMI